MDIMREIMLRLDETEEFEVIEDTTRCIVTSLSHIIGSDEVVFYLHRVYASGGRNKNPWVRLWSMSRVPEQFQQILKEG